MVLDGPWPGKFCFVGECEQFCFDAVKKLFVAAAVEVGAAHAVLEKRVAGEQDVAAQKGHAAGCVARVRWL